MVAPGVDLRGRLGRIATALSQRLARGESLSQALYGEKRSIPPLYRAVVEAGSGSSADRPRRVGEIRSRLRRGPVRHRTGSGIPFWW